MQPHPAATPPNALAGNPEQGTLALDVVFLADAEAEPLRTVSRTSFPITCYVVARHDGNTQLSLVIEQLGVGMSDAIDFNLGAVPTRVSGEESALMLDGFDRRSIPVSRVAFIFFANGIAVERVELPAILPRDIDQPTVESITQAPPIQLRPGGAGAAAPHAAVESYAPPESAGATLVTPVAPSTEPAPPVTRAPAAEPRFEAPGSCGLPSADNDTTVPPTATEATDTAPANTAAHASPDVGTVAQMPPDVSETESPSSGAEPRREPQASAETPTPAPPAPAPAPTLPLPAAPSTVDTPADPPPVPEAVDRASARMLAAQKVVSHLEQLRDRLASAAMRLAAMADLAATEQPSSGAASVGALRTTARQVRNEATSLAAQLQSLDVTSEQRPSA